MWIRRLSGVGLLCLSVLAARGPAATVETAVDLAAPDARSQWKMLDATASIANGELVLDGRKQPSRAVFLPCQWGDVILRAQG